MKLLADGIDPKSYKLNESTRAKEEANKTLENVAALWMELKQDRITKDHAEDIWRSLENHVFPKLGNYPITQITAPLLITTLKPLEAKGSLETVKRVTQRMNEIMIYSVNTGILESNPIAGVNKSFKTPKANHYATIKKEELPKFLSDLNLASIKLTTRCLIEWQLNTMVRPNEAAGARWEEINFKKAVWNIPAERMKKKRPHAVPLSKQCLALLKIMKPISGHREHIFPSDRNPKTHINSSTANMALKRMGYKDKLVAHGMRSLASTTLNEEGFDFDVIETALAHVDQNSTRSAYNRADYLERRAVMMQWWSDYIEEAAKGNISLSSNVINFR